MGLVRIVLFSPGGQARDFLLMALLANEAFVSAVGTVEELRRALLDEVFDVLVVDAELSHREARCLAAAIADQPSLGMIVMGDSGTTKAWRLRQAADAWLERPVPTELLAATARSLVMHRRALIN